MGNNFYFFTMLNPTKPSQNNTLFLIIGGIILIIVLIATGILTIQPFFGVEYKTESISSFDNKNSQSKSPELLLSKIENCGNAKLKFDQNLFKILLHYRSSTKESGVEVIDYAEFNPIIKNQYESFAIYCRVYKDIDSEIIKELNDFKTQLPKLSSSILISQKFEFVVESTKIKNQISYQAGKYIKEGNKLSIVTSTSDEKGNPLRSDKIYQVITKDGISYHIGVKANNLAPELKLDKSILELNIEY